MSENNTSSAPIIPEATFKNFWWYPVTIGCLASIGLHASQQDNGAYAKIFGIVIFPTWWIPIILIVIISCFGFPLSSVKRYYDNTIEKNTAIYRKTFILKSLIIPIVICFLTFGRAVVTRILDANLNGRCKNFGWIHVGSLTINCDAKPVDIHGTIALLWLFTYPFQVVSLLAFNNNKYSRGKELHKLVGRNFGFGIAFLNTATMLLVAYDDYVNPMETHRPPEFSPFMTGVGFAFVVCVLLSLHDGIWAGNIDAHILWIYRAFLISFTTPVIRFYPLALRKVFGIECLSQHLDSIVMSSTAVSLFVTFVMMSLVQIKTQPIFWDTFMKLTFVVCILAEFRCFYSMKSTGSLLIGMTKCGLCIGKEVV